MEKNVRALPLEGRWDIRKSRIKYLGPYEQRSDKIIPPPVGTLLFDKKLKRGTIRTKVRFEENGSTIARIIVGYDSESKSYYSVGIGGYNLAYLIDRFDRGVGWHAIVAEGDQRLIKTKKTYIIEARLEGQRLILKIDNNEIFNIIVNPRTIGNQIGLFSWGSGNVVFRDIEIEVTKPRAFVIIKFDDVFAGIYEEIIVPICSDMGLEPYKADEVYKPGIIMEDVTRGIAESEIVIADITPVKNNENVYYEVGYAHALDKEVILLARRGFQLPFDIAGYRVIFYDDISEKGKKQVENNLKKHLKSILK